MCFFRKKVKEEPAINSKFQLKEEVLFRNKHNELTNGYIYQIHVMNENKTTYDVQIGGECPTIIYDVDEDKIIKNKK